MERGYESRAFEGRGHDLRIRGIEYTRVSNFEDDTRQIRGRLILEDHAFKANVRARILEA